jgi:hypothetical protein
MSFANFIDTWGLAQLAADLGLPTKNVRRWVDNDSIPAEWFAAVARASRRAGRPRTTEQQLAAIAERRRLARTEQVAA